MLKKRLLVVNCLLMILFLCASTSCQGRKKAHTHNFGEWKLIKESTCKDSGTRERTCLCGEKEVELIVAKGHSFDKNSAPCKDRICATCGEVVPSTGQHVVDNWTITKAPTCDSKGEREGCCICGHHEVEQLPSLQHDFGQWQTLNNACCEHDGQAERVCKLCGKHELKNFPKHHTPGEVATCENPQKCTTCGEILHEALGHAFDEWKLSNEEEIHECKRCSKVEKRTTGLTFSTSATENGFVVTGISDTNKPQNSLFVPNFYNNLPVVSLGDNAFVGTNFSTVELPCSVTSIGENAFANCPNLSNISMPNIKNIGENAFKNCPNLVAVSLPSTLVNLQLSSFANCRNLVKIEISPDNICFSDDKGVLLDKAKKTLLLYPKGRASLSYSVPSSIDEIAPYAFANSRLTTIFLPPTLTTIGDYAFEKSALTKIILPTFLTTLGDYAFCSTKISSITVPATVISLGKYTFSLCENLETVHIKSVLPQLAEGLFDECINLKNFTIFGKPPVVSDNLFPLDVNNLQLFVEEKYLDLYKNDLRWNIPPNSWGHTPIASISIIPLS